MGLKNISRILFCAIIACAGCKKSESTASMASAPTNAPAPNSIATNAAPLAPNPSVVQVSRLHWLGKKKIAADTNSASLMAIWNLPESARLENQTLDKLSSNLLAHSSTLPASSNQLSAPSSLPPGSNPLSTNGTQIPASSSMLPASSNRLSTASSNEPSTIHSALSAASAPTSLLAEPTNQPSAISNQLSAKLRPLLEDVLNEESYLEIRSVTNGPAEWIFAIRLDPARAALWETNLSRLSATNPPLFATPGSLPSAASSNQLSAINSPLSANLRSLLSAKLTRSGDWTIFASAGRADLPVGRVSLLAEALARVEKTHSPFAPGATNWLDADMAWNQICSELHAPDSWLSAAFAPRLFLAITGDGKNVLTHGQIHFATAPTLKLEPWNIPTNLISPTFASFTAVRGLADWVNSAGTWTNLQMGAAPNQLFCWAVSGMDMTTYFATPSATASNQVVHLAQLASERGNPWLATNASPMTRISSFEKSRDFNGIEWKGLPFVSPFVKSVRLTNGDFVQAGFFPTGMNRHSFPLPLLDELAHTNLCYYDFELTGPRTDSLLHITQFFRMIFNRPQMLSDSSGLQWLQALTSKLGPCVTEIATTTPDTFSFTRKSGIGLTGIELHLLTDWLESPDFPQGLHTTRAPMPFRRPVLHKSPTAAPAPPPGM